MSVRAHASMCLIISFFTTLKLNNLITIYMLFNIHIYQVFIDVFFHVHAHIYS